MSYDFSIFKKRITEIEEWLVKELGTIRTGRATPAILDSVRVESYGARLPISNVAGITLEDARTIRITPWDKAVVKDIEKAISADNLGLSLSVDDKGIRVIFPELTSERRAGLLKLLKSKHEEARVSLRKVRDEIWDDIQDKEKDGAMSEDDKFRGKDEMQKMVDNSNKKFDDLVEKKTKEISN